VSAELSRRKTLVFSVIAVLSPLFLLAVLEVGLRAAHYGGETPLFESPEKLHGLYLVPARRVGARYFPRAKSPPSPPFDAFLVRKPVHGITARINFQSAFAVRIGERLSAEREQATTEVLAAVRDEDADRPGTALVLQEKALEVADFYQQTSTARGHWRGWASSGRVSTSAQRAGRRAADAARTAPLRELPDQRRAIPS